MTSVAQMTAQDTSERAPSQFSQHPQIAHHLGQDPKGNAAEPNIPLIHPCHVCRE